MGSYLSEDARKNLMSRIIEGFNILSGLQQGIEVDSQEGKDGMKELEDIVMDVAAAFTSREIIFGNELPYPPESKI